VLGFSPAYRVVVVAESSSVFLFPDGVVLLSPVLMNWCETVKELVFSERPWQATHWATTPPCSPNPTPGSSNDWKSYFKCKLTPLSKHPSVSLFSVNLEVLKTTTTTNTNTYNPNMATVQCISSQHSQVLIIGHWEPLLLCGQMGLACSAICFQFF
jgi:hypothetical protein